MEERVLTVRSQLKQFSDLGEWGAAAIRQELMAQGVVSVPSVRTIGRIVARRGAVARRYLCGDRRRGRVGIYRR